MKKALFRLMSLSLLAMALHADPQKVLRASFPDGTGLEIFTETTGSSPIDSRGVMGIGPGTGSHDLVNRVVIDRDNNILFAYNLEASRGTTPNTVMIRIAPLSSATEAIMLRNTGAPGHLRFSGEHLPTVARPREFPAVKIGEAVTLDILYNPATRETIFDVLHPITTTPSHMSVEIVPSTETISLKDIAMRVNGRPMPVPPSFVNGSAVRIDIPRYGTYVLAAYNPHETSPDQEFTTTAQVQGKTLTWTIGRARIEITSSTNVLTRSTTGTLWIKHDPHYQPDVVGLQSADTVEWLLPKR